MKHAVALISKPGKGISAGCRVRNRPTLWIHGTQRRFPQRTTNPQRHSRVAITRRMLDYNINLQSVLFMLHCPTKSVYFPCTVLWGPWSFFKVMLIDNVSVNRYLIESFAASFSILCVGGRMFSISTLACSSRDGFITESANCWFRQKRSLLIAPCKRIYEGPGFRPRSEFWIPTALDFPTLPDSNLLDSGFHTTPYQNLPDYGFSFMGRFLAFLTAALTAVSEPFLSWLRVDWKNECDDREWIRYCKIRVVTSLAVQCTGTSIVVAFLAWGALSIPPCKIQAAQAKCGDIMPIMAG